MMRLEQTGVCFELEVGRRERVAAAVNQAGWDVEKAARLLPVCQDDK